MEECGDESTGVMEKEVREIPIVFVVKQFKLVLGSVNRISYL